MTSRARAGFTLIEVLIAVGILTGALASAAMLLTSAFGSYRNQNRTLELNHLVHDEIEHLTNTPYDVLKTRIMSARRPVDPNRDGLPPENDFTSVAGGEAKVEYLLEPPAHGSPDFAYKIKPRIPLDRINLNDGQSIRDFVEAKLELQFWDPVFDGPSLTDRGLVRAAYQIRQAGVEDRAVKYLTR